MATDQGGKRGPQSTRTGPHERFPRRDRGMDNYNNGGVSGIGYDRTDAPNGSTPAVPPAVPGFGFQYPMFPPNFMLGVGQQQGAAPAQPPPPGQG